MAGAPQERQEQCRIELHRRSDAQEKTGQEVLFAQACPPGPHQERQEQPVHVG